MSKILISLINQECILKSEDGIWFNGNADLKCKILEDEWVKLSFINKKSGNKIKVIRSESIESIEFI